MGDMLANARRLVQLFEQLRSGPPGPAFEQLKQLNLSFSHLRALRLLAPDRQLPMKELAEQLQLTAPSVTALTRRLVQTGLVRRATHAEDSRVVLLSLTAAGRALHDRLSEEHVASMARLLQGLTPQEQQQFLDLLERAVHAMRTSAQESEPTKGADVPADRPDAPRDIRA